MRWEQEVGRGDGRGVIVKSGYDSLNSARVGWGEEEMEEEENSSICSVSVTWG